MENVFIVNVIHPGLGYRKVHGVFDSMDGAKSETEQHIRLASRGMVHVDEWIRDGEGFFFAYPNGNVIYSIEREVVQSGS